VMGQNALCVNAMHIVQIASWLATKDRRSSHQGCFDDRLLKHGSKVDAACLREDYRLDRRGVRPAPEPRISGLGARNDCRVV
jgi:hypothetical protein